MEKKTTTKSLPWQVTSWEQACAVKGLDPEKCLPDVSGCPENLQKFTLAAFKLAIIAEVVNEGWVPNWDDGNWKYWPWFDLDSPGFRFPDGDYGLGGTGSFVGSRLCYSSREKAKYMGETFLDLYRDFMVIPG